jgi:hypothetical protein
MTFPTLLSLALLLARQDSAGPRLVDGFEQAGAWKAYPAEGVLAMVHTERGHTGLGLRVDFDFQGRSGYAIARRALSIDLPVNYAFSFWIRGDAPVNTLEFKLIDSTGDNVWWYTERDRSFPRNWQRVTVRRRQIGFAWGPAGGGEIRRVASIELVITAGAGGGKGSVWFDDLVLTPLPDLGADIQEPVASSSTGLPSHRAENAVDGDSLTTWRPGKVKRASLTVDFQQPREFGGLTLRWEAGRAARDYDVELSSNGRVWEPVREVRGGNGGRDELRLGSQEARYCRLNLLAPEGEASYSLAEITVRPPEYGATMNGFWQAIAASEPEGTYPRYFSGRRAWWTVVGLDGAKEEALFNEDGAVEAGKGEFSLEPFVAASGRIYSWHEVTPRPSLAEGMLPIPSVDWNVAGVQLTITAFAIGPVTSSSVVTRYRVRNIGDVPRNITLYVAVRPFQVNPPWQFLNIEGGAARIESLEWNGSWLKINGNRVVVPFTPPAQVGVSSFDGGEIGSAIRSGRLPVAQSVHDPVGAASGALAWNLRIAPGDSTEVAVEVALTEGQRANLAPASLGRVSQAESEVIGWWRERLDRTRISLPAAGDHIARSIQSTLAYILINRDGPAIQPGSRSYERSWIRDGSLTSTALLRFGYPEVVREFIEWYARYQYPNGKVPCCVDRRGADPVPEHDSHGEFIYLVMEYWRHTGDTTLLRSLWPNVLGAANYIDSLRQTRRTEEYQETGKQVYFGLLPPSISHEGYSAKPMHSYWDDFFALRGLKDAARMAEILGNAGEVRRLGAMRDEFRSDLLASINRVMAEKAIDYIPGAADLGDFDATSTTIALSPVGEEHNLPRKALERTFERYWGAVTERRAPGATWEAYTPYELRAVGTLLRLFGRERALDLLNGFLADQEPPEWNQWPEVVWRDPRTPKFIGDSPHTWVGSDFLRSAADLFAYEDESDSSLVIARGVDQRWLADSGVVVRNLGTWYGPLSYSMRADGATRVRLRIETGIRVPAGGLRVAVRSPDSLRQATLNGARVRPDSGVIVARQVPAELVFEY